MDIAVGFDTWNIWIFSMAIVIKHIQTTMLPWKAST